VIEQAGWPQLDPVVAYELLRLRVDVFVVEQECPYPELDGRDVEPGTRHWWTTDDADRVSACLRVLAEPDGSARIGRVATRAGARGRGLSGQLLSAVLEETDAAGRVVTLEAQSHLAGWYGRFGFVKSGDDYEEDGIPHTPMRREPVPREAVPREAVPRKS
jgi:ElaA protein